MLPIIIIWILSLGVRLRQHRKPRSSLGILFALGMIEAKLITLLKQHKPPPKYVIDELASQAGHTVLRLPAYHCKLIPIKLVWAELKCFVARSNATFKKDKVKELFNQARSTYGVEK